jgi:hypothetical protein
MPLDEPVDKEVVEKFKKIKAKISAREAALKAKKAKK